MVSGIIRLAGVLIAVPLPDPGFAYSRAIGRIERFGIARAGMPTPERDLGLLREALGHRLNGLAQIVVADIAREPFHSGASMKHALMQVAAETGAELRIVNEAEVAQIMRESLAPEILLASNMAERIEQARRVAAMRGREFGEVM